MEERLNTVFSSFEGKRDELIPLLQQVQGEFGYLPEQGMREVARFIGAPESSVYAVATFYTQFRFTPLGKYHIMMCRGTACHVRGAPRIREEVEKQLGIKEGETTPDQTFSLETVACIGACGLAPCIVVNHDTHGRMTPEKVVDILADIRSKEEGEVQDEQ